MPQSQKKPEYTIAPEGCYVQVKGAIIELKLEEFLPRTKDWLDFIIQYLALAFQTSDVEAWQARLEFMKRAKADDLRDLLWKGAMDYRNRFKSTT